MVEKKSEKNALGKKKNWKEKRSDRTIAKGASKPSSGKGEELGFVSLLKKKN